MPVSLAKATDFIADVPSQVVFEVVEQSRHDRRTALEAIQRRDPDGDEDRTGPPTDADYAAHERWAVATYGDQLYQDYVVGGWATPEV
jgi:hypothetical protein